MIIATLVITACVVLGAPAVYGSVRALKQAFDEDEPGPEFRACVDCRHFVSGGPSKWVRPDGSFPATVCAAYGREGPQDARNKDGDCKVWKQAPDRRPRDRVCPDCRYFDLLGHDRYGARADFCTALGKAWPQKTNQDCDCPVWKAKEP